MNYIFNSEYTNRKMISHCKTETITVNQLYKWYLGGNLIKAPIQRKNAWKRDRQTAFIIFVTRFRNTGSSILLNKIIMDNKELYMIIDGNNRINTILDYIIHPLWYENEHYNKLLDYITDRELIDEIHDISHIELKKCTTFKKLCKYLNYRISVTSRMEAIYEQLYDSIISKNIYDVVFPATVYYDADDEDLCDLYEGINKGGINLTKQEILAATTAMNVYTADDLPTINGESIFDKLKSIMNELYDDMDSYSNLAIMRRDEDELTL